MHYRLAEALFDKNLFTRDMEVEGKYKSASLGSIDTTDVSDIFLIRSVGRNRFNQIVFSTLSTRDGHRRLFLPEDIVAVDGMLPARFASVYGIAADGSSKRLRNRRGRKPKIREVITPEFN